MCAACELAHLANLACEVQQGLSAFQVRLHEKETATLFGSGARGFGGRRLLETSLVRVGARKELQIKQPPVGSAKLHQAGTTMQGAVKVYSITFDVDIASSNQFKNVR